MFDGMAQSDLRPPGFRKKARYHISMALAEAKKHPRDQGIMWCMAVL